MPLTFTPIKPDKADVWLAVARGAWLADEGVFLEKARRGAGLREGVAFALRDGAEILGTVMLVQTLYDQPQSASLFALAVAPKHQGKGLGRRILAESCTHLRRQGITQVRLFTSMAGKFYEKAGFKEFGTLPLGSKKYKFFYKDISPDMRQAQS